GADLLAPRLAEAARQLAPVVAAVEPAARRAWAVRARHAAALEAPVLSHENAIASIAIEWLAATSFATDRLLQSDATREVDLLIVVEGLRQEPLAHAIAGRFEGRAESLSLAAEAPPGRIALHEAADPSDE